MDIRALRKARGLTLKEVADEIGTDPGNLSRIERGVQPPGIALAKSLASFYCITLEHVYSLSKMNADGKEAAA